MDLMIKILVTTFFVVSICLLATAIHNLIVDIVFGFCLGLFMVSVWSDGCDNNV